MVMDADPLNNKLILQIPENSFRQKKLKKLLKENNECLLLDNFRRSVPKAIILTNIWPQYDG